MIKGIPLYALPNNTKFTFQMDSMRPKKEYWFKCADGMYGQIFETVEDMKKFKNPAFISMDTIVQEVR